MTTAEEVLAFWLEEKGPANWYAGGDALDREIRERFRPVWEQALVGRLGPWLDDVRGTLAYLIVTDQLGRNMFRGTADAYATDPLARQAAHGALARGFDLDTDPPARQFFYMPFEHCENLAMQEQSVALFGERLPHPELLLHARAHRELIRRFGRFPHRNDHLGRHSTPAEQEFLAAGSYGGLVSRLRTADTAGARSDGG